MNELYVNVRKLCIIICSMAVVLLCSFSVRAAGTNVTEAPDIIRSAGSDELNTIQVNNIIYASGETYLGSGMLGVTGTLAYNTKTKKVKKLSKKALTGMFYYDGFLYGRVHMKGGGNAGTTLYCINAKSGKTKKLKTLGVLGYTYYGGYYYYVKNKTIYRVDDRNGNNTISIRSNYNSSEGDVYGFLSNKIYILSVKEDGWGTLIFCDLDGSNEKLISDRAFEPDMVTDDVLFFGTSNDKYYKVDGDGNIIEAYSSDEAYCDAYEKAGAQHGTIVTNSSKGSVIERKGSLTSGDVTYTSGKKGIYSKKNGKKKLWYKNNNINYFQVVGNYVIVQTYVMYADGKKTKKYLQKAYDNGTRHVTIKTEYILLNSKGKKVKKLFSKSYKYK